MLAHTTFRIAVVCWLLLPFIGQAQPCLKTYLKRKKGIDEHLAGFKPIYNFQRGDVIASVGAGSGNHEIIYGMMDDSLTIYLQDINPTCLSAETIASTVNTLYSRAKRTNTARYVPVIGTLTATNLPRNTLSKVLIENSLHEFSQADSVLADIGGSLRPGGTLFIYENLATKPGEIHQGCKKPLFTRDTLVALLARRGFTYLRDAPPFANVPNSRVFVFRKE